MLLFVLGLFGVFDWIGILVAGVFKTYSIVVGVVGIYFYGVGFMTNVEY